MSEIKTIKVPCPLSGASHKDAWVERREQIGIPVYKRLMEAGGYFRTEGALEAVCKELSDLIIDWELWDDEGNSLPKPYQNPDAFMKLAEVDSDAFLWINTVIQSSIDKLFEPPKKES